MSAAISTGINSSTVYQRQQAEKAEAASGKVTHQSFLKLLTTQLCKQDPLSPMEDIDFTAQLAQLQALDEQMEMTKTMSALRTDSQLQAGTNMIGKFISGTDTAGNAASGLVTRTVQNSDGVFVELANKQQVLVGDVNNIWNDATSMYNDMAGSSNVIGMWVEAGLDANSQPIHGIVEKITVEGGSVMLNLYGGKKVGWDQVTELRAPTEGELWYTLPDDVREKVEKSQKMIGKVVTGKDESGKEITGMVAEANLNGSKVQLTLFSGAVVDIDSLKGEAKDPTAQDLADNLNGYWVTGLDEDGSDLAGIITGAGQDDAGMYFTLDNGKLLYYDTLSELRKATDEERARLQSDASGEEATGNEEDNHAEELAAVDTESNLG